MVLLMGKSAFSKDVERIVFPTTAARIYNAMVVLEECSPFGSVRIVGGEGAAEKLVGLLLQVSLDPGNFDPLSDCLIIEFHKALSLAQSLNKAIVIFGAAYYNNL